MRLKIISEIFSAGSAKLRLIYPEMKSFAWRQTLAGTTDKLLNTALIGYGYAGKTIHAPLIYSTPGLRLKTIVSSQPAKVLADFADVQVYADAEKAFSDPTVDLIVIATPNTTHCQLTAKALNSGKNVVVDKPFVISTQEAVYLFEISQKAGKLTSVFHNRRWDADFLTLQGLLSRRRLGEVMYFQSNFDRYRPVVQARWREQDMPGSGLWFDLGSHLVDQALLLFGAPDAVYCDLTTQRGSGASDYFHAILHYGKKRIVLHGSSLVPGESPRFVVHGTTGSYVKYGLDTQEDALKKGHLPGAASWGIDPLVGTLYTRADGELKTEPVPNLSGNYSVYYEAVRDAILLGKPNPVTIDQAGTVTQVLELGIESALSGRTLEFQDRFTALQKR